MVTSVNPSSLRVSWQPLRLIDENGLITDYVIEYGRSGGQPITTTSTTTTRIISRLDPFVVYSVRVAARNSNGTGTFSSSVSGRSGEDGELTIF